MPDLPPWHTIEPSSKQIAPLSVCRRADGSEVFLSLHVVRGAVDGPTLLLMSGVHGDEYEGPAAMWRTYDALDPVALRGTLVLLPVANPPAYAAGQRANPADPKDLARTFPGRERGSVTEQIAHAIQTRIMPHVDLMCDFHSAGRFYTIDPWTGYALVPDARLLARQREAACVVGYPLVWGSTLMPGRSVWAAFQCGVPALYVEAPGEGRAHAADIERNVRAARQLLRFMRMLDESVEPLSPDHVVEDDRPDAGHLQIQTVARHGGYFEPAVTLGGHVEAAARFGRILDTAGRELETIPAAVTGRVIFLRTFPIVEPGDSLGTVLERL